MRKGVARTKFFVMLAIAAALVGLLGLVPLLLPSDVNATDLGQSLLAPGSAGHALGTDTLGRDVLLRTLAGGSESVTLALAVVAIVVALGTAVGLAAGLLGGAVDAVLSKVITAFQAFPAFVLAVAIAGVLGQGLANMIIAIAAVYWTQFARLVRGIAIAFRESECVAAARVSGAPRRALLGKYLLPEAAGPVAVLAAVSMSDIVLTMAGLSFIGLGPARPTNEWGAMMAEAQPTFQYAIWCMLVPMAALFGVVVVFNLLGDSLRDALDVRSQNLVRTKERGKKMGKTRRTCTAIASVMAVVAALSLVGCGSPTPEEALPGEGAPAKELHAGSTTYFFAESMDPASDWDSWYLSYYGIVENLFRVSDDLTAEPWLAESADVADDGLTWTIKVREGVTFSNGRPVDAEAVKAAWERTYAKNSRAAETLAIASLAAEGQTLTVTTAAPVPGFENILCDPLLCVYYVGEGVDYANDTPATGPYKKVEFVAEDHIVMEPNTGYWNGTPKLDRVVLSNFTDDNTLTMAMQTGEIDAVAMPSASALATLAGDDYQVFTRTTSRADFIRMNMTHPLICIDRNSYASVICQGSSVPSWGVYSATLPFGGTQGLAVTVDAFSVEAAARVLDKAGIVDADGDGVRELDSVPVELDLYTCSKYERFVHLADDLQSKLGQAGIRLNIVPTDYFLEDAETFAKDDPDMTLDSYAMAPTGNAAYFANMSFATGASNNFGKYSNAQVDALIEQLNATYETAERDALATEIAQQVLNDAPYIFFANTQACVVARAGVSGLDASPSEYYFVTVDADVA